MLSIYSVKMVLLFPVNMKLLFFQESKDNLLPKNKPKVGISGITEKDDTHSIGILDWHSRKSSSDSLYFYGTFIGTYMVGDILQWRIFNTLYHSALRSCI